MNLHIAEFQFFLVKRKNFFRVHPGIIMMAVFYVLIAAFYFLFDAKYVKEAKDNNLLINYEKDNTDKNN